MVPEGTIQSATNHTLSLQTAKNHLSLIKTRGVSLAGSGKQFRVCCLFFVSDKEEKISGFLLC